MSRSLWPPRLQPHPGNPIRGWKVAVAIPPVSTGRDASVASGVVSTSGAAAGEHAATTSSNAAARGKTCARPRIWPLISVPHRPSGLSIPVRPPDTSSLMPSVFSPAGRPAASSCSICRIFGRLSESTLRPFHGKSLTHLPWRQCSDNRRSSAFASLDDRGNDYSTISSLNPKATLPIRDL